MNEIYKTDPNVTLNEKDDDWAILTNTKTGKSCGISKIGVFIWKNIDGKRTKKDILAELEKAVVGKLPPEAEDDFDQFVAPLI